MCSFNEDLEHLYFTCVGILICAIADWPEALIAAGVTVACRAVIRKFSKNKGEEK